MRIVFMGTPDFAVEALKNINTSRHEIIAVVTQKDKPGNRNKVCPPPIKTEALRLGLDVLQYDRISKEGVEDLKALNPDIIVTAAFGQILSREILSVPKYGVINIHASLLPKYRGSSPIQWSVINGDEYSGVTIMQTAYEVDSGDIIRQSALKILDNETAGELFDRLSNLGASMIVKALDDIEEGKAVFTPQIHADATYCKMLKKSDGKINFCKTNRELDCFVRGMTPWPGAFFILNGNVFKVFSVEKYPIIESGEKCGAVLIANADDGLIVKCSDGAVRLAEIQAVGGKRMKDTDYLRGHSIEAQSIID